MDGKQKTAFRTQFFADVFASSGLEKIGFKIKKGCIYRTDGRFLDEIVYGSSPMINSLSESNMMTIRASKSDMEFKKHQHDSGNTLLSGHLGGGHLENLFVPGPPYVSYDIGITEEKYTLAKRRIIHAINEQCLPFFDLCCKVDQMVTQAHLPAFHTITLFNYSLFLNQAQNIKVIVGNLVQNHAGLGQYLKEYYTRIETEGIPQNGFKDAFGDAIKMQAVDIASWLHQEHLSLPF